ncbi:SH3 domain-containing protein [Terrisporobacter vanillatitrophus]
MRKGPGTSYAVIATLNKGTMVHKTGVIRHANGYFWQSITYNGKDGWVVLDYVS